MRLSLFPLVVVYPLVLCLMQNFLTFLEKDLNFHHEHGMQAATSARALFSSCYKANNQLNTGLVLLLLADIHKRAGSPVTGLPYALAGLTLSQSFSLDLLQVTAMVTIAELWLDLGVGHAAQALLLLYQCLPIVLGHGGLELRARTNLAVARCHLSNPSFSVKLKPEEVLEPLHQAAVEYGILEVKYCSFNFGPVLDFHFHLKGLQSSVFAFATF
jgi:hypothetical protein